MHLEEKIIMKLIFNWTFIVILIFERGSAVEPTAIRRSETIAIVRHAIDIVVII